MLKRKIIISIMGGLLGVQAGLAGAQGTFPPSTEDVLYALLPAEAKYLADREAANPNPSGAAPMPYRSGVPGGPLPATLKYLAQRQASLQAASGREKTVKFVSGARYITIDHEALVKIENDKGQSFVWKADTLGEADLSLQSIAPREFVAGTTRVFVRHPYEHSIKD